MSDKEVPEVNFLDDTPADIVATKRAIRARAREVESVNPDVPPDVTWVEDEQRETARFTTQTERNNRLKDCLDRILGAGGDDATKAAAYWAPRNLGQVVHLGTRVVTTFAVCEADGSAARTFEHEVAIKELLPATFATLHDRLKGVQSRAQAGLVEAAVTRAMAAASPAPAADAAFKGQVDAIAASVRGAPGVTAIPIISRQIADIARGSYFTAERVLADVKQHRPILECWSGTKPEERLALDELTVDKCLQVAGRD